jgi:hypothetical protein
MIPKEYKDDSEKEFRYYLWTKESNGVINGIVTTKRNPKEMSLLDIFGEYIIENSEDYYVGLENIGDIDKDKWVSIINTESDSNDSLKISWLYNDSNLSYGVDVFDYVDELINVPFNENDAYAPEWNKDALYHIIKNNVDKMYSLALQEHIFSDDDNSTMRNYQYANGDVSCKGPYYKFDVDNILYKIERGYEEYNHLNAEIINLETGKEYEYVRYINNVVDIKPLTWVLLGFDYTRITGRIINDKYPKWTLIMVGSDEDKIITTHNGLYFTYLFENDGIYKIKLELIDINKNKYEIEKPIVIVNKDANYEMYHTLKDEYDKYLEYKNERSLIYLNK